MSTTDIDNAVLHIIATGEGQLTAKDVAKLLQVEDDTYGIYQAVSRSVARLRKLKLVSDVAERCGCCGSALTRGVRNVKLRVAV